MGAEPLVILFAALCVCVLLCVCIRNHCLIKGLLASAVQGVSALYAVRLLGFAIGISLPVNFYTLGTGLVLGSPGVALILAVQTIFHLR
ncbi:MAG: pro-sigmaK processing inhibitor BofA family protein [Clostridia bacterium]|nr:pro-sigmaK processing inhibitor BofA family protein [Clostridia bacterium]